MRFFHSALRPRPLTAGNDLKTSTGPPPFVPKGNLPFVIVHHLPHKNDFERRNHPLQEAPYCVPSIVLPRPVVQDDGGVRDHSVRRRIEAARHRHQLGKGQQRPAFRLGHVVHFHEEASLVSPLLRLLPVLLPHVRVFATKKRRRRQHPIKKQNRVPKKTMPRFRSGPPDRRREDGNIA